METSSRYPWTLRFASDELESAFRTDYVRKSLRQVRYALLLGIVIYGFLFGWVDYLSVPSLVAVTWPTRALVCAFALGAYLFTYAPRFERYMQPVLSLVMLLAGWGLVLMLALDPSGEYYFEGPVLIILPAYVAVQLRFVYASAVGWLIVAAYFVVAASVKDLSAGELTSSIIFISSANIIGMFAGYMLEDYARRQFRQAQIIDRKREENEALLQARSRFFANVSHELRTPLTLIIGPLSRLTSQDDGLAAAAREQFDVMHRNARRLQRLINQLLDISKLEAGRLRLAARPGRLVSFLKGLLFSFSAQAQQQHITLRFDAERDDFDLYFDADKLEKVVVNLLSNAFKHTPENGSVGLTITEPNNQHVEIAVKDTGNGIPEEELPHVFDRFHQAHQDPRQGTGIGLALTKELVELHHGRIRVESEVGFGSTFTVTLPQGKAHLSSDEIADDRPPGEPPSPALFDEEPKEAVPSAPADGSSSVAEEKETVLVVEDHPDMRAFVKSGLTSSYNVLEARDGAEALDTARDAVPDLIITDVMMPGMDGFELCRQIKEDDVLGHIPVVLLTAKAASENAAKGFETGADAYVTKPFNARTLKARVDNLIATRKQLRQRFSQDVLLQPSDVSVQSADETFIERTREVVEAHMDDSHFNVGALAEEVGFSRRQLRRKLKAVADTTPSAFIRLMRLKRGAQLLEQQYGTVSETAYAVGFNTPSHFSKSFHDAFGMPPSEYAASRKSAD